MSGFSRTVFTVGGARAFQASGAARLKASPSFDRLGPPEGGHYVRFVTESCASASSAMQAVSVRSVRGPMVIAWKPCAARRAISKSFQPPSGPIAIRTRWSMPRRMVTPVGLAAIVLATRRSPSVNKRSNSSSTSTLNCLDGDSGKPGVARLLQPFDQQGPVASRRQDVRVEIASLHAFRVGQNDLPDPERGDLSPEPPHHLRSRQRKQKVYPWPGRSIRFERAVQSDSPVGDRLDGAHAARAVEDADAHLRPRRDLEDVHQVRGAGVRKIDLARPAGFAGLEDDQVHEALDSTLNTR